MIEKDFSDAFVGLETYDVSPRDPSKLDSPPAKDAIRVLLWCSWNKGVEFDWSDVKTGLVSLFKGATDNQTTISQYLRYMARDGEIELIQTGSGQASSRFRNICDVARRNKFVEKIPEEYRSIRKTEPFSQQIEDLWFLKTNKKGGSDDYDANRGRNMTKAGQAAKEKAKT